MMHYLLLAILVCSHPCQGKFLNLPRVLWTYHLPESGALSDRGLRSGNEVLASPDGTVLFATADDGSLHFVVVSQLNDSFVFEPDTIPGAYTECRSGVTLVYDPITKDVDYVLYAVADVPVKAAVPNDGIDYDPSRTATLSRLLAVNLNGTLRFSVPLNGAVVGKPVVGDDRLYVAHNVPNLVGSSPTRGKVSIVMTQSNPPTVIASVAPTDQYGPFGPPTGTTVDLQGKQQDVVVVAEAWDQGYSTTQGNVYLLRPSSLYEDFGGQGNDAYELKLISKVAVSSYARPSIKADATEIYIGAAGARLSGWTTQGFFSDVVAGSQIDVDPSWAVELETNTGNASQPLLVAPILSKDEKLLYQVGASTQVYGIDTQTGDTIWASNGALRGAILVEPRVLDVKGDEAKVYVIGGMTGTVRQYSALTGTLEWAIDCHFVTGIPCHDAVEADFSVAPTGNTLYYGDIFGKIVALEFALFTTAPPTAAPTVKPTGSAEVEDEISMTAQSEVENSERTSSPTISPVSVISATSAPAPLPVTEPGIDSVPFDKNDTEAPEDEGDGQAGSEVEPDTILLLDTSSQETDTSEADFSRAKAAEEDKSDSDSFFSNELMIILVAVCGGLAVAVVVLLIAQRIRSTRNIKEKPMDERLVSAADDGKGWHNAQDEYEAACRKNEEETLREIVGLTVQTPTKHVKKNLKKQKKMSPITPSTLASIEESPAETELSFICDAKHDEVPKNLEKVFEAMLGERKAQEVALKQSRDLQDATEPLGSDCKNEINESVDYEPPPQLSSVEVVAKCDGAIPSQKPPHRTVSLKPAAAEPAADCTNEIMSVDESLYLDDDSYLQGSKVEVASLSQFSVASTADGASAENYPSEGQFRSEAAYSSSQGDHHMNPTLLASPMLGRNLSPIIADYIRRKVPTMPQNPMTPKNAYGKEPTSPLSSSPMTPPQSDSYYERRPVRKGESVRPGGSGRQGRNRVRSQSENRGRTPSPPKPPVSTEDDEPEDAWHSFLSELAKAEKEFFNPSFKNKKNHKLERPQSPPPPPPGYPPQDSSTQGNAPLTPPPPDPPVN